MTKRMLIDTTHAEETRVVVLDGNRLEDFDVETSTKQQLKGNIYLAKIVRVEPSLQAAFVEFGGGRHGFLAFGEIHPDYYQIPVADRKRLLELQEAEAREEEEEEEREALRRERGQTQRNGRSRSASDARDSGTVGEREAPGEQVHAEEIDHEARSGDEALGDQHVGEMASVGDEPDPASLGDGSDTGPVGEASESAPVNEAAGHDIGPDANEPAAADALTESSYAQQADPEAAGLTPGLPAADAAPEAAVGDAPGDEPGDEPGTAGPHEPGPHEPGPGPERAQPASIAQDVLVAPAHPDGEPAATDQAGTDEAGTDGSDLAPEASESDLFARPASEAGASFGVGGESHDRPGVEQVESNGAVDVIPPNAEPEQFGGEHDTDERPDRREPSRFLRNYKIQEVMRRRQILLVQVVKEERGTKGAALTTYISLAGRFSVLMPNSPRGGGISRKITSAADRRRLKEITAELELPRGMGLIVRTAGAARPKPEILRDCEYLLNEWDQIRETTMRSMAPAQIYEEASLIKRAIRDVYSRDVEEILVDGEEGWRAARDFMRMLMPAHAKKVQLWRDPQPLFAKAQVESQLDAMLQPTVQLRSGGYLVINQTEALVAIDVNSGRSTRERGIEETALRTNMEAAEEAARQLRLRDLAGLIVIDFIDMESRRNNASVEKRLKDSLKNDRARIQVGSISHFGLLEMSRQRLRPSIAETNSVPCPHCGGTGHMRSTESAALSVLRAIEDEGGKRRSAEIIVHVHGSIALYILNHKRARLGEIEQRFGMHVTFHADDSMIPPANRIEKVRALLASEIPAMVDQPIPADADDSDDGVMEADDVTADAAHDADADMDGAAEDAAAERGAVASSVADAGMGEDATGNATALPGETAEETEQRQRKRRRRRRGGRREEGEAVASAPVSAGGPAEPGVLNAAPDGEQDGETTARPAAEDGAPVAGAGEIGADGERKRRGRRGGRRRRREPGSEGAPGEAAQADGNETEASDGEDDAPSAPMGQEPTQAYVTPAYSPPAYTPPAYVGPTPANPFGGDTNAFAFFDAVEEVDTPSARPAPAPVTVAPEANEAADKPESPAGGEPTKAGPTIGAAIVPTVVGDPDAPAVEKKKGWWRR